MDKLQPMSLNPGCCVDGQQTQNGFYNNKWLGNIRRLFHDTKELYEIQVSVSIHKVLWKNGPVCTFVYDRGLFLCYRRRADDCD